MVRFGKNGNDATTAAVRLARHFTGKKCVVLWLSLLARLVCGKNFKNSGVPGEISKLSHRFIYGNKKSIDKLFKKFANKIACVIIDPFAIESKPNKNFLMYLEKNVKKKNCLYF